MPLFDTHAHLDDDRFSSDLETIIEGFTKETKNRVLCVATGIESSWSCLEIATKYAGAYFSAGIHPNSITQNPENSLDLLDLFINLLPIYKVTHNRFVYMSSVTGNRAKTKSSLS